MGGVEILKIHDLNDRLMLAERGFLDTDGLQGRQWFKHLVSSFLSLNTARPISKKGDGLQYILDFCFKTISRKYMVLD